MRLDSHMHLWQRDRGDYGWLTPKAGILWADFGPSDGKACLDAHAIDHAILVQAAPTLGETRFLLNIANQHPWVAGVVGWIDFDSPNALDDLETIAAHPALIGVRPMVQDIDDPDWLLRPTHGPIFDALAARKLVFDALVRPLHLPRLLSVAHRHPSLCIVLDHGGKPDIASGDWHAWAADIGALADCPNVVCKLSGLITEAGHGWDVGTLKPIVNHLLEAFGPQRLLWGSDWPVCTLAGSYKDWYRATQTLLAHLSETERAAILGVNALTIYKTRLRSQT
jgi:L-fuconolactonase